MQPNPPPGFRVFNGNAPPEPWGEIDPSVLEAARGKIPQFPLQVLPPIWARWVDETAQSAGTSADYIGQGLLACVAAVCGAGVMADIAPGWQEPLVLWHVLVGSPAYGKSPALAAARRLLERIEEELRALDGDRQREHETKVEQARFLTEKWKAECEAAMERGAPPPLKPLEASFDQQFSARQLVVSDSTIESLADVVSANPRGVVLWRDELAGWLGNLNRYSGGTDRPAYLEAWAAAAVTINRKSRSAPLHLARFPVSIIGSIQPDRIAEALTGADDGMGARFLYAWPSLPRYRSILGRKPIDERAAQERLGRIAAIVGTIEQPRLLHFTDEALALFDQFLAELHVEAANQEGLEAGFLGKGRGTVARLAAAMALLRWSEGRQIEAPTSVDVAAVQDAAGLWSDYFRPHACAVINRAGRSIGDRRARTTARWLVSTGVLDVSREDIRRDALAQAVTAAEADKVISHLVRANILRLVPGRTGPDGGRPANRWAVNPALRSVWEGISAPMA
jgi:hypothetical protein